MTTIQYIPRVARLAKAQDAIFRLKIRKWTNAQIGNLAGCHRTTVGRIQRGKITPSWALTNRLFRYELTISLGEGLLTFVEEFKLRQPTKTGNTP